MPFIGNKPTAVPLSGDDIQDGTIGLADLSATGTKDATTFLRGDNTFAEAGGGKIAQIVSTTKTDTYSASVGTEAFTGTVTGLTVSITPSATNSKILVFVNMIVGAEGSHGIRMQLFRDTTQIDLGDTSSSRPRLSKGIIQNSGGEGYMAPIDTNFLDTPSTTSSITYGVKIGHTSSLSKTLYVNRSHDDSDDASYGRGTSTITVMEVLA